MKDIYYVALEKGEMALAEVAKKKADEIDSLSMTTDVGKDHFYIMSERKRKQIFIQSCLHHLICDPSNMIWIDSSLILNFPP